MANKPKAIRRYFIGGLLVWLPIWATYVVVRFLVDIMDSSINLLPHQYRTDIPGIGFILTIIILFVTGLLVTNFIGTKIIDFWESLLSRIPLIRSIYTAVKQVTEAVLQPSGKSFRKVLLIEFPRKGLWSLAFQTSEVPFHAPDEQEYMTVFVPTSPNPTSGFLMVVRTDEVIEVDMTVEEGLKTIISIGVANVSSKTEFEMKYM
jgi:uncharacterized membrane protein